MLHITLPDHSQRQYPGSVTVAEVAASIGTGLAKAALAGKIDGKVVDTSYTLDSDTALSIVTARDPEGLDVIRHSAAHVMAQAVTRLFPGAKFSIGPAIENGFYQDFLFPENLSIEDLPELEKRMNDIIGRNLPLERRDVGKTVALEQFSYDPFKVELISEFPDFEPVTFYQQGDYIDLCRGPHFPRTGVLPRHFKLMSTSGAYWRGSEKNPMLQRIYGVAFATKPELDEYLRLLEEAKRRDHRKIGKALDLFHMQEEAPGMVFWHPNGWTIYQVLEQYMRKVQQDNGYLEIRTPQVVDFTLWEKSGHAANYADGMFTTHSESRNYAIKPMNCPCHVQVFNQGLKSYRDLPIRLAEFGSCHRNEPSGSLHGIMRVRGFTQDDAHIFCTKEQIGQEVADFIQLTLDVYKDFGFEEVQMKLSTRPEKRVGDDALWDMAEKSLADALDAAGLEWELQPGEGAFYGPKIEFSLKDCLGRVWQCGTIQCDFNLPERLDASYVTEDNDRDQPVMLHRAILGSFERFIGILIEHYAGFMPPWLTPIQACVMNITDSQAEACESVVAKLKENGLRAISDLRNEKIGFKIRERTLERIPYLLVLGDREVEEGTVNVRTRSGTNLGTMSIDAFVDLVKAAVAERGRYIVE